MQSKWRAVKNLKIKLLKIRYRKKLNEKCFWSIKNGKSTTLKRSGAITKGY